MGDRAVIATDEELEGVGLYLHYCGDRAYVEALLKYCELHGYRSPENDSYGWVCLAKVIGNYFGHGLGAGLNIARKLDCDNHQNGVYIIKNWQITGRMFFEGDEDYGDSTMEEILRELDDAQPDHCKLTDEEWKTLHSDGNLAVVLQQIEESKKQGKKAICLEAEEVTRMTLDKLEELGYDIEVLDTSHTRVCGKGDPSIIIVYL